VERVRSTISERFFEISLTSIKLGTVVGLLERWYNPAAFSATNTGNTESLNESPVDSVNDESQEIWVIEKAEKGMSTQRRLTHPAELERSGIFIGGVNLSTVDVKWWRSKVGLVQQEPFLFNDTIFSNVANGLSGTEWQNSSQEEKLIMVKNACKEAYADEFISRLPQGYETMVGKGGMKISGGQRQRIAIARAIIKQPAILILDEATSAIDVRTEKIVQKALDRVSLNRTTITIAHRLSTIRKADKIVVLRDGKLAEEGTHEQLLEIPEGVYSGFVKAQAVEMGEETFEDDISEEMDQVAEADKDSKNSSEVTEERPDFKQGGFIGSFGLLLFEQRSRWIMYTLTLLGAMGGGGKQTESSHRRKTNVL
jgi:ATP-binding cassette subfamily B (MDR/TAP) protein 1